MRVTLVVDLFEKYAKCPECEKDIVDYEVKEDEFSMSCECGWGINGNEQVAEELIKGG